MVYRQIPRVSEYYKITKLSNAVLCIEVATVVSEYYILIPLSKQRVVSEYYKITKLSNKKG